MKNLLTRLLREQSGATAVEYGLILGLVVLAMLSALSNVANVTTNIWTSIDDAYTKSAN